MSQIPYNILKHLIIESITIEIHKHKIYKLKKSNDVDLFEYETYGSCVNNEKLIYLSDHNFIGNCLLTLLLHEGVLICNTNYKKQYTIFNSANYSFICPLKIFYYMQYFWIIIEPPQNSIDLDGLNIADSHSYMKTQCNILLINLTPHNLLPINVTTDNDSFSSSLDTRTNNENLHIHCKSKIYQYLYDFMTLIRNELAQHPRRLMSD